MWLSCSGFNGGVDFLVGSGLNTFDLVLYTEVFEREEGFGSIRQLFLFLGTVLKGHYLIHVQYERASSLNSHRVLFTQLIV